MKDTFEHDVTMPQSPPEVELLAPASVCLVLVRIIRVGEIKSYPKPQSGWISACVRRRRAAGGRAPVGSSIDYETTRSRAC